MKLTLGPQKIPNDLLQNLTGLGHDDFGTYVAKLANYGIKKDCPNRILNLEQMALLERTKVSVLTIVEYHSVTHEIHTVVDSQKGWKSILLSKMLIFKRAFHRLRVLSHLSPPQNL